MPSKYIWILSLDFWVPWKQNRICALSLFLTSPNCPIQPFPNFYLMTHLLAGPSPSLCLPTGGVHASPNREHRLPCSPSVGLAAAPQLLLFSGPFSRSDAVAEAGHWELHGMCWGCSSEQRSPACLPPASPLLPAWSRPHGTNAPDSARKLHWVVVGFLRVYNFLVFVILLKMCLQWV